MLPAAIGSHTQERSGFQEAGHAVLFRMGGGAIEEIQIALDLRTNIWEGQVKPAQMPGAEAILRTFFAGPLAEARLVANLYQPHPPADWTIDRAASIQQLSNLLNQPGPVAIQFSANGQAKVVNFDKEMFGGDWQEAQQLAQQNGLQGQLQTLLEETIDLINRDDVWGAIIRVAVELLKLKPRLLVWMVGPSAAGANPINKMIDGLVEPL